MFSIVRLENKDSTWRLVYILGHIQLDGWPESYYRLHWIYWCAEYGLPEFKHMTNNFNNNLIWSSNFEPFSIPPGRQRKLTRFFCDWGDSQTDDGWIESMFTWVPFWIDCMNRTSAIGWITTLNASLNGLLIVISQTAVCSQFSTWFCDGLLWFRW